MVLVTRPVCAWRFHSHRYAFPQCTERAKAECGYTSNTQFYGPVETNVKGCFSNGVRTMNEDGSARLHTGTHHVECVLGGHSTGRLPCSVHDANHALIVSQSRTVTM